MGDDLTAVDQHLSKEGTAPIYLVQGPERLMVDETVRRILTAAVGDPRDPMAVTRVDLAESGRGARDVLDACRSMGLFASRQAVLVRATDALTKRKADLDEMAAYASDPDPHTTLVLKAEKLNGNMALVRRIRKHGRVFTFETLKQYQVPAWLSEEARRVGHPIDHATARLVADLVGTDLARLRLTMEQLSLYVGDGAPITAEAVEEMLVATRAHSIFELVDAVAERRLVPALRHLHAMLAHREPGLRILAMLIRHFRMLWLTAEARAAGASLPEVQKKLSLHQFVAKKVWAQSGKFDARSLRRAWDRLYRTDRDLKSSGLDDALVMERLVMDLCGG
ncbi:MAG: DNA polymerase III subunit delta [Myxococcota bacterium]